jgi:type VI protein secretion system component Hcp
MLRVGGKVRAMRALVAVLCALLGVAASRPVAAASNVSLTLAPAQGLASGAFTMTFTDPALLICPGGSVTFFWDTTSRTLATAPLSGPGCTATATAVPPAGFSAPGVHVVIARLTSDLMASATYQVVEPAVPTATPRPVPTRTPARRPSPTPSAAPIPTPSPPATAFPAPAPAICDTKVPQATGVDGYLEVPGVPGDTTEPMHAGAILVKTMEPASMLPPAVGTAALTEVGLLRAADRSSPALLRAVSAGTHFDCVQLELGPGPDYLYATYAFHDALFSGYSPSDGGTGPSERLTLSYVTVDWEYQLRDGSPVAIGRGNLGGTPDPRPLRQAGMASGSAMVVLGLFLVGGGTGGGLLGYRWWNARRRRDDWPAARRGGDPPHPDPPPPGGRED